jgi:hypothetical protein
VGMDMRKTGWLFVLVPILVLGWAVGALADDETDVFNANAGNTNPNPNPGENFVVIQDVIVSDPGPFGDTTPDSFPTAIETVTIRKVGGRSKITLSSRCGSISMTATGFLIPRWIVSWGR